MNDSAISLAMIARLVRRRWPALLVLAVVGALVGAASSFVLSPGYVSTSKVLLQGSRDETQLPGEVQVATSLIVLDRAASALGWGVSGSDLQSEVSAAIDSNVIEISGAASSPQRAQQLTDRVTTEYTNFSNQIVTETASASSDVTKRSRDTAQQLLDDANKRVTELQRSPALTAAGPSGDQARNQLDDAKSAVTDASQKLDQVNKDAENAQLDASLNQAGMRVIEPATLPPGPASPTLPELVAGGAVVLVLLGILMHLLALRTDRRLHEPADIAAALGAPLLGAVEIPAASERPSLVSRILHDDRLWAVSPLTVADADSGRDSRYHRVLGRLSPGQAPASLLVVVPDGDQDARRAVVELAIAGARHRGPVGVITDDPGLEAAVTGAEPAAPLPTPVYVGPGPVPQGTRTVLRVARVETARPMVQDTVPSDGALVVVSARTCTGWELAAVSGACVDAGHPVRGVLVTQPRIGPAQPQAAPGADGQIMVDEGPMMAGTT